MSPEVLSDPLVQTPTAEVIRPDSNFLDFLLVLGRKRRFILFCTFGLALLTVVVVLVLPSQYTAETVIMPPSQSGSLSSALLSQFAGSSAMASLAGSTLGIKNTGDLYASLLRSRTIEDSIINRFGLLQRFNLKKMSDARHVFESKSKITLGVKDGLIRIAVTDKDPRFAAQVANGYVDEFRKQSASMAITEASQRREFFQQQLRDAEQNLTTAEEAMKHTEQTTGMLQIDSQARLLMETAASLRAQIVAKEVSLRAMRSYGTSDNPEIVTAEQELSALKEHLAQISGSGKGDDQSDIILPRGKIPEAGLEYLRKLRDVRYYETIEELLAKQFEMAKLDEARQGALIQVVDVAIPPDGRSFPKRTLTVGLVFIIAFFASCGWVVLQEQLEQVAADPADRAKIQALKRMLWMHR